MRWIVISDIHINYIDYKTTNARKRFIEKLEEFDKNRKIDFVIIAGDLMFQNKGDKENKDKISKFIEEIMKACNIEPSKIFICAGNHDVSRKYVTRNKEIRRARENYKLPKYEDVNAGYGEFNTIYTMIKQGKETYEHYAVDELENVRLIRIDSTLMSLDDNDIGRLAVCFPQLEELESKIQNDGKLNIVYMHHGIEWLEQEDSRNFQHWCAENNIDIIFCGHNHLVGVNVLTEAIKEEENLKDGVLEFTCGAMISDSNVVPTFFLVDYDECKEIGIKLYQFLGSNTWQLTGGTLRGFNNGIYNEKIIREESRNRYKVYETIYDIDDDIAQEIGNSKNLIFYGLRGKTLINSNSKMADEVKKNKDKIKCKILVSNPYNKYIGERLKKLPEFENQSDIEKHWKCIYENIKQLPTYFSDFKDKGIRYHELPLVYRFIMTDDSIYFGYYTNEHSSKSLMYRYGSKSDMYLTMKDWFDSEWENSDTTYSSVVPDRCSFLQDKFKMYPSLVINLTDKCNMNCQYCPKGGENLQELNEETLCDIDTIKLFLKAYVDYCKRRKWKEKKVLRITGGEPLLSAERLHTILKYAYTIGFEKIVLCTNGVEFEKCYEMSRGVWEQVKDIVLLKISLDTLNKDTFCEMTGSNYRDKVIQNIQFARSKGFKIELNMVATKKNVSEIYDVYEFAKKTGLLGVKVLTINDFGGKVETENVEEELNELIEKLRRKKYKEISLYVHNNKGICMKRFIHNKCTLTIVDHMNNEGSVTPRRTYSEKCKMCKFYPESYLVNEGNVMPCATGIMSLNMRADGVLSYCRLMYENGENISGQGYKKVREILARQMSYFEKCYHYEIGEKNEEI